MVLIGMKQSDMKNKTIKYMSISFIANIFLTIIKVIFGYISKSKTLIADGIHCLSDMSTDIIGIFGAKISNKEPDEDHPYGHGKAEYVTSLFISIFIIYLSVKIFVNSFSKTYTIDTYYILIVSFVSIVVKFFISGLLIKKGKEIKSSILTTSGTESRFDVLSSFLAFIFILLSFFSKELSYLKYADTIGSIVISLLTLRIGIKLFIENFKSSIGEVELDNKYHDEIKSILSNYEDVKNIRRITILKYGSYRMINIDIEMLGKTSIKNVYKTEQGIKKDLRDIHPEYKYINIDIKPIDKK